MPTYKSIIYVYAELFPLLIPYPQDPFSDILKKIRNYILQLLYTLY